MEGRASALDRYDALQDSRYAAAFFAREGGVRVQAIHRVASWPMPGRGTTTEGRILGLETTQGSRLLLSVSRSASQGSQPMLPAFRSAADQD
jgi:hypothetical protein